MFFIGVGNTIDIEKDSFKYAVAGIMDKLDSAVFRILRNAKNLSCNGEYPLAFIEEYGHSMDPLVKYRKLFRWDYEKCRYIELGGEHFPDFNIIVERHPRIDGALGDVRRCKVCLEEMPIERFTTDISECLHCKNKNTKKPEGK